MLDSLLQVKQPLPKVKVAKEGSWWSWYAAVWRDKLTMQAVGWSFVKILYSAVTFCAAWTIVAFAPIFVMACIGPKKTFAPIVAMARSHRKLARRIIKT